MIAIYQLGLTLKHSVSLMRMLLQDVQLVLTAQSMDVSVRYFMVILALYYFGEMLIERR